MKIHKIELIVIDFNNLGDFAVCDKIESARYPNDCIIPQVLRVETRDCGEWNANHPLNRKSSRIAEIDRLFGTDFS